MLLSRSTLLAEVQTSRSAQLPTTKSLLLLGINHIKLKGFKIYYLLFFFAQNEISYTVGMFGQSIKRS